MTDLLNEVTFCDECPYSGEPNGCNREEGVCKAHESYFDLVEENDTLRKHILVLNRAFDTCKDLYVLALAGKGYEGFSLKVLTSGLSIRDFLINDVKEAIKEELAEEEK